LCGGSNGLLPDGGTPCAPATCQALGYTCGIAADGCGGVLSCGTCTNPQYCGGGGFDQCGGNNGLAPDGGVACAPTTCAALGYTCGIAADGCGGVLDCGSCSAPQYCGGGGYDKCGGNDGLATDGGVPCTPQTCAGLGYTCGAAGDGCGGTISCGSCTNPRYCGGGGFNKCGGDDGLGPDGGVVCTPETCSSLGYDCGAAGDGCGGLLDCGSCTAPQYCGGGGYDVCGPTSIASCDSGGTTSLSGYVYDPANNLPVYNALVYVPAGAVPTPQTGPTCGCSAPPAIASAYTGIDGSFTLTSPPSGGNVTVVVQLGKWQRVFTESVTACQANSLSGHLTLPSNHAQGNIPLFAVDTGNVDTMECVLLKMGIARSEFVDPAIAGGVPTATGRVHLYQGSNYQGGAVIDGKTPTEASLTEASTVTNAYDVILFPCQGGQADYTAARGFPNSLGNVLHFANAGGRVFATHFSYTWLYTNGSGNGSFAASASWTVNNGTWAGPLAGYVDDQSTFPRGQALAKWLNQAVVYGGTYGQIPVDVIRNDFSSANPPAQEWMYNLNPPSDGCGRGKSCPSHMDIHYTFDTPFNESPTCGRVVFSDFHVENSDGSQNTTFPSECSSAGMTPQEKLLEFMLFDLTSCVSPPTCTPRTCAQQGITCGPAGDGCGGQLDCGSCASPLTCGGGGVPGQCGYPDAAACVPKTCGAQNVTCGPAGDGCGNLLQCGTCTPPQTCGGGGVPGQCGYPDAASCKPLTCAQQNIGCGPAGDGCGNHIDCGTCSPPAICGGGGAPSQCGYPDAGACVPETCAQQTIACGPAGDGCGGQIDCGTCTVGQTCGGGGVPGQCGTPDGGACAPESCAQQNIGCGPAGDGCGNLVQCGNCPPGQTCGGGGVPGQCGAVDAGSCVPLTCQKLGVSCGPAGDGCGNLIQCGTCALPQTCGGGGTPGQCGGGSQ
jgi:hypothetical protein